MDTPQGTTLTHRRPTAMEDQVPLVTSSVDRSSSNGSDTARSPLTKALVSYEDLPDWRQDNHYVLGSYRATAGSYARCYGSLTYIHNETVNIFSHGIGAVVAVILAFAVYQQIQESNLNITSGDILACGCFFLGAALCLGMSSTYHTINNHSLSVARFGNALDYLGIVCLIAGSFVPNIFYGYYCSPKLQALYWTMMGSVGLACAVVSVKPEFRLPKWRTFRATMFIGMGLSSLISIVHGCILYGSGQFNKQMRYEWMIYEGIQYVLGATLYAARVPERFNPGLFDILGTSHQIFHVLVLTAAYTHLVGVLKAMDYAHNHMQCSL